MNFSIPYQSFTDLDTVLTPGTYRLYFKNPFPKDIVNEVPEEVNLTLPIPTSDYEATLTNWRYVSSLDQFEFIIRIAPPPKPDIEIQKSGIEMGYVIAAIASVAVIGVTLLVFVKGEKILYIPSIAIIGGVILYFYKEISGFFK